MAKDDSATRSAKSTRASEPTLRLASLAGFPRADVLAKAAGRFATVANRFVTLANRLVMLANRLVMLANRFVMLADRFVMLADRFVTLADRFAKVGSAPVEASLETFISFRISAAFSFQDLRNPTQTLLTDLGLTSHGASGSRGVVRRMTPAFPHPASRLPPRVRLSERAGYIGALLLACAQLAWPPARDFARPSTVSVHRDGSVRGPLGPPGLRNHTTTHASEEDCKWLVCGSISRTVAGGCTRSSSCRSSRSGSSSSGRFISTAHRSTRTCSSRRCRSASSRATSRRP